MPFAKDAVNDYLCQMQRANYHGLSLAGIFYRDRDEWMRAILSELRLNRATRMVACAIILRTNPKSRQAWPQQKTLAKELGLSVPTVKLAVHQLASERWLSVTKKIPPGGRKAVNHYEMIHPADREIECE